MLNGLDKIEGLTPEQLEAINGLAGGLISKKLELEEKLSKTKLTANENQSAVEKLAAFEASQAQTELENKQNYDAALALNGDKFTKQINELTEKVGLFEQKERSTLISNSLSEALTEARVNPLHSEYVSSYFKQQAQLIDGKVVIGDKSLSDAIKEWSETDQGKAVRLAPENVGGNSKGSTNVSGSGNQMSESEQRAFDINKRFGR
jgi:phage I-like protein